MKSKKVNYKNIYIVFITTIAIGLLIIPIIQQRNYEKALSYQQSTIERLEKRNEYQDNVILDLKNENKNYENKLEIVIDEYNEMVERNKQE